MFSHTKAEICGRNWIFMDELLKKNHARCMDILDIQGFPYLRGTRQVLEMAGSLQSKYAYHQWLELLRRIDLTARYKELFMLPDSDLEKFCAKAGIECFPGRIRAYVARCSAIIMGDEKRNHGFQETLKKKAAEALKNPLHGSVKCFENSKTMDGLLTEDVLNKVSNPQKSSGVRKSASYLEQRIQRSKQAGKY